jgi:hypothetical protein
VGSPTNDPLTGKSLLNTRTWNHLVLIRHGAQVDVYLNGERDISGAVEPGPPRLNSGGTTYRSPTSSTNPTNPNSWLIGGSHENKFNLEGKIDEVAFYNKAMTPAESARHFELSGFQRSR